MLNPGSAHLVLASLAGGPRFGLSAQSVGAAGSGYTVGDTLTLVGGTLAPGGLAGSVTVSTVSGGTVTGVTTNNPGNYSDFPKCVTTLITAATFDPAAKSAHITLSNGNLTGTCDGAVNPSVAKVTAYQSTGKFYCEFTINTAGASPQIGLVNSLAGLDPTNGIGGSDANGYGYSGNGQKNHNGGGVAYGASFTTGDVISMAFDATAGTLNFWKNGVDQGQAYTGITGSWTPAIAGYGVSVMTINLGTTSWAYTPPAGYTGWGAYACVIPTTGGTGTGATIAPTFAPATPTSLDRITKSTYINLSNGNLTATCSDVSAVQTFHSILASLSKTVGGTTKLYCEATYQGGVHFYVGLAQTGFNTGADTFVGASATSYAFSSSGFKWNNNVSTAYGSQLLTPTTIGMEFDLNTGNVVFTVNGVSQGTAFTGLSGTYFPALTELDGVTATMNFGASAWAYSPPAGYVGWF